MTAGVAASSGWDRLVVMGVDADGAEVARLALGHGDDPATLLAADGWKVQRVRDVIRHPLERHLLTLTFVVEPSRTWSPTVSPAVVPTTMAVPRQDDDLVVAEGEVTVRRQRVAAYALVTSARGVLMTQFSEQTYAPGQWGPPGGGLEAEEAPEHAVEREVWEESGQLIEVGRLAAVQASRWVGRAPAGQLEDFHAVRVVYHALCPEPTDPVVHDVGGTTASAAWVPPGELDLLALTAGWRSLLGVVMAPDQTEGTDQGHHQPDADDRARTQP